MEPSADRRAHGSQRGAVQGSKADAGRRYRAYPTPQQAGRLAGWGHSCRAVWNLALAQRQYLYRHRGVTLRAGAQGVLLTRARAELPWLADLPAQSAQQVLRHLDRGDDNWWNPQHPAGPPTFKKRSAGMVVPFPGQAVKVGKLDRRWAQVRPPKIGGVRFRLSRPLGGAVRNATVRRDGLGWHVSFGVASEPAAPNGLPGCGVDFGVACSAWVSDETSPRLLPPTLTAGEQRRLLGLERRKARQVRWAKRHNRGRSSRRLAAPSPRSPRSERGRRAGGGTSPKLTTDLAKRHGWVGIEDLRVKNMTRSAAGTVDAPGRNVWQKAGLHRGILDNAPYERRRQLAYKAPRFGSELRGGPRARHLAAVLGVRAPRPPIAAGLRAGVCLHRLRPPGARRPQRLGRDRGPCPPGWRHGHHQHAQSPPGGKARKQPHA